MWVKNITDFVRFCNLNIPCLRINITVIFMSSSSEKFRKIVHDVEAANLNLQNLDACLSVSHKPRKVAEIKSKV